MGGVIHDTYDDSWAYVKVAGSPLPAPLGGVDTADNRAGSCKGCNREKGTQSLLGFLLGVS